MTQKVRNTSLEVFEKLREYLGEQEILVYKYIVYNPNLTRNEIAEDTGIKQSTVGARINSLIKLGLVKEGVQRKDYHTGNTAYTVYAVNSIDWNLLKIDNNVNKRMKK